MRRKSSAQNLLSSFKSPSAAASTPAPLALGSATALSFAAAVGGASTPTAREWDAQSLASESVGGSALAGAGSPQLGQGTSAEYLRDLVQKRIITLTYIRNVHEGRTHWFHTVLITRADLDKEFSNYLPEIKKRAFRFTVLGMSLSSLLDINQPQDLLRGLLNTITEYDQNKDDNEKPNFSKRFLRPTKITKRLGGGFTEYSSSSDANSDTSYLITPHIPFALDYHQTLLSLLDVLSEVYNKISKLLGPSPFPHAAQHMMGPLGLLSPHPGVSYLFPADSPPGASGNATATPYQSQQYQQQTSTAAAGVFQLFHPGSNATPEEVNASLWGIANGTMAGGGAGLHGAALNSPPSVWMPVWGETVLKIDSKFKKITSMLLKELDTLARNGIKDELASLDPLLRNIKVDEGATGAGNKSLYEYDA